MSVAFSLAYATHPALPALAFYLPQPLSRALLETRVPAPPERGAGDRGGGRPIDVAYVCRYLASGEPSWVTGSELVLDGGLAAA